MKRYYRRIRLIFNDDPQASTLVDPKVIFEAPKANERDISQLFEEVELFPIDLDHGNDFSMGAETSHLFGHAEAS